VSDPLRDPEPLIRRVYAYAAYRLGDGPDAEDVTSETFERAIRYRKSYNRARGTPAAWLVGIARRCVDDLLRERSIEVPEADVDPADDGGDAHPDAAELAALRLDLAEAVARLSRRERDLVALRFGADLRSKEIAELLDMTPGAVDVALHRARGRLRAMLEED
jgi:RNA polymerase sigma-70 factor (ECF subfamily)